MLQRLELGPYHKHDRVSYLFNSDRQLRAVRGEFDRYWRHLPEGGFLLGSAPTRTLRDIRMHLIPQFFPVVVTEERKIIALDQAILYVEPAGRLRFQD